MTEQELKELIATHPVLYHMTERGSWPSIRDQGLNSTLSLLDRYSICGSKRNQVLRKHRSESIAITGKGLPTAVIRDQVPMSDKGLRTALPVHMTPADWYETLNSKVFFWLSEDRLHRLACAKAYREHVHKVIEACTGSLIEAHNSKIWLCPYNSGATKPNPFYRDERTFQQISEYPYHTRPKRQRAVELAVDYAVRDIRDHVLRVVVKKGKKVLTRID